MSQTVSLSALPKGTAVLRFVRSLAVCGGDISAAAEYAGQYRNTPEVELTLRAAVAAGSTTNSSAIAQYGIGAEVIELERGASILGRLSGQMTKAPFRVSIPIEQTGAVSA